MPSFNLNNFNDLIKSANSALSCGPTCQKQKTKNDLKNKYLAAKNNEKTAVYQVYDANKNYLTFTEGESGYNEYVDKELEKKGSDIADNYNTNFNKNINTITDKINTFNSLFLNVKNVGDLYKKYKNENDLLEKKINDQTSDIITNNRKTYYEEEGISKLNSFYYFFLIVYIIVVVIFALACIFVNTTVSILTRIIILILLIVYPIILMVVFDFIKKMVTRIKDYLPSYAYRNI